MGRKLGELEPGDEATVGTGKAAVSGLVVGLSPDGGVVLEADDGRTVKAPRDQVFGPADRD